MSNVQMSPPPLGEVPRQKSNTGLIIGLIVGGVFLVGTLLVGLCAGLLLPALGAARNSARIVVSQANLKQIGTALQAYAVDNKDALPEEGADLKSRLAPYIAGNEVWNAPGAAPGVQSYYYVPIGKLGDVKNPSVTPLMYEAPGLWRRGGGNILYVDGSVRRIDGVKFDQTIDGIKLPDGRAWTPHKK